MHYQEIKTRIPALPVGDAATLSRVLARHDAIKKLTGCTDAVAAELCKSAAMDDLTFTLSAAVGAVADAFQPSGTGDELPTLFDALQSINFSLGEVHQAIGDAIVEFTGEA